jgi:hypothetical protein
VLLALIWLAEVAEVTATAVTIADIMAEATRPAVITLEEAQVTIPSRQQRIINSRHMCISL